MVKKFLESTPELYAALADARSALLVKIRDLCAPDITMSALHSINRVIEADATVTSSPLHMRNQRAFAVKTGISGMLDVARQTYKELTEEVHAHMSDLERMST